MLVTMEWVVRVIQIKHFCYWSHHINLDSAHKSCLATGWFVDKDTGEEWTDYTGCNKTEDTLMMEYIRLEIDLNFFCSLFITEGYVCMVYHLWLYYLQLLFSTFTGRNF